MIDNWIGMTQREKEMRASKLRHLRTARKYLQRANLNLSPKSTSVRYWKRELALAQELPTPKRPVCILIRPKGAEYEMSRARTALLQSVL